MNEQTLEAWVAGLDFDVPSIADDKEIVFAKDNFSTMPTVLITDKIIVENRLLLSGTYGTVRYDSVWFQAQKESYEALGLLTLAAVFHNVECSLILENKNSSIKKIIIHGHHANTLNDAFDAKVSMTSYEYWPRKMKRRFHACEDRYAYPSFELETESGDSVSDEDLKNRTTLMGFGRLSGHVNFAKILLDLSRPENKVNEYNLEKDFRFGGVAPGSAEARFSLPGGDCWFPDWFE